MLVYSIRTYMVKLPYVKDKGDTCMQCSMWNEKKDNIKPKSEIEFK